MGAIVGHGSAGPGTQQPHACLAGEAGGSGADQRLDRARFVPLLLAALAVLVVFRWDATVRARGPLIADGVEYLMMAKSLVTGDALAVKPVRSGFFGVLLAVPLFSAKAVGSSELDHSVTLIVPLLFHLLAVVGTFRLGQLLAGPWAGLMGAFLLAVLPEFTYWSTDFLTDVPAAAVLAWAAVFWLERRPFWTGVALGVAVLLRYQCLIPLGAFLLVPLVRRRWRALGWTLLGLVPPIVVLGVVDWLFWGRAFQSFLLFVPRQLGTFVPRETLALFLPEDVLIPQRVLEPPAGTLVVPEQSRTFYLDEAPRFFLWTVLGGALLVLPALRRVRSAAGVGLLVWVSAVSLAVLSAQRYRETRYLCSLAPYACALAGVGAFWLGDLLRRLLEPRAVTRWAARWAVPAVLLAAGVAHARPSWEQQQVLHYRPFSASLVAVQTIPLEARPCSVALADPWVLAGHFPIRRAEGWSWYSNEITALHLATSRFFFRATPEQQERFPGRHQIEDIDYFVVLPEQVTAEPGLMQWINDHTVYDGYFFEPGENRRGALRLRTVDPEDARGPFWRVDDQRAREDEALGSFEAAGPLEGFAIEVVGAEARRLATAENAVRLDLRWRLPDVSEVAVLAMIEVWDEGLGAVVARENEWLVPNAPRIRDERSGQALRTSSYTNLAAPPSGDRLGLSLRLVLLSRESPRQELRPTGSFAGPTGDLRLRAPLREPREHSPGCGRSERGPDG